jgi:hypothetical protein
MLDLIDDLLTALVVILAKVMLFTRWLGRFLSPILKKLQPFFKPEHIAAILSIAIESLIFWMISSIVYILVGGNMSHSVLIAFGWFLGKVHAYRGRNFRSHVDPIVELPKASQTN